MNWEAKIKYIQQILTLFFFPLKDTDLQLQQIVKDVIRFEKITNIASPSNIEFCKKSEFRLYQYSEIFKISTFAIFLIYAEVIGRMFEADDESFKLDERAFRKLTALHM